MCSWLFLATLPLAGATSTPPVSFDDVLRGLRDTDAAIASFSLSFRCEIVTTALVDASARFSLHEDATIIADDRRRARYEGSRSSVSYDEAKKPHISETMLVGTYNGKITRSMEGIGEFSRGTITESRSEMPWQMDPWNFLTQYFNEPIYKTLEKHGSTITGKAQWQGSEVVVIESQPIANKDDAGRKGKLRFLVNVQRGFAVVERSGLLQFAPDLDWVVYTTIRGYDYVETSPGLWFPMRIEHESFDPSKETVRKRQPPPLAWRWDIRVKKWTVNEPLEASTFELRFPRGVFVNDRVLGRSYRVTAITDQTLADEASGLRGTLTRWFSWRRPLVWGAMALIVFVGLIAVVRLSRRRVRG